MCNETDFEMQWGMRSAPFWPGWDGMGRALDDKPLDFSPYPSCCGANRPSQVRVGVKSIASDPAEYIYTRPEPAGIIDEESHYRYRRILYPRPPLSTYGMEIR